MFSCFIGLKNVFPTVKILTFSRGEFKYVQMDQGLKVIISRLKPVKTWVQSTIVLNRQAQGGVEKVVSWGFPQKSDHMIKT
jgi:hypothetical protein